MSQIILIRLKGYGDKGEMRDVAEIVVPAGMPPVKSMKVITDRTNHYLLDSVDIQFHEKASVG